MIDKSKSPLFQCTIRVRDYECDAQGIVNNANYQHYYEIARHDFFNENGLSFFDLHESGTDAVVVSAYIRYTNSLKGGDNFISTVDFLERDGIRYIFNQKIVRLHDNKVCSTGKFEVVCITNGKLAKPEAFDRAFGKYFEV
ncbi:MAG: acyl-CoA thioesterase [Dysgonomonas sp.]|jgi:acyl-CoA thioester hydrolase|nr:acyl-CoA thioesterase [Prevotella sp.]MDR3057791.1 acyl-CoA thioesterase [Prevotella sp.]